MLVEARKAINCCEERLRVLMAEASASGKYDEVNVIMHLARKVNELSKEVSVVNFNAESSRPPAKAINGSSRQKRRSAKRRESKYPQFIRSRTDLLKIGWSKKDKKEYQHKAPWAVVELLCQSLKSHGFEEFTSDEVLPLVSSDEEEIPSYQSYLCLAWMRESGLIIKEGRQGYRVPDGIILLEAAKETWRNLPQKLQK